MTRNTKRIAFLCFTTALVSVILLSLSLSNLEFHPGSPFPGGGNTVDAGQSVPSPASAENFSSMLWKGIIDLILILLLISVPVRLIPLVNMKRLSQVFLVVVVLLLIASLFSRLPDSQPVHLPGEPLVIPTQSSSEYPVSPLGQPPDLIVWFVIIGLILGAGLVALRLSRQSQSTGRVEDQLAQEAAAAVEAIKLGEGLRGVIIHCYVQMGRALQEEQKIERRENMTVREFEDWLARKGFPTVPIQHLSHLFEKARYGRQEISKTDEMMAIESLNEIIQFCRSEQELVR